MAARRSVRLRAAVTFSVDENGSGKATLLEALVECCGFNPEAGTRDQRPATRQIRRPATSEVTRDFMNGPERFFKHLLSAGHAESGRTISNDCLGLASHPSV